MPIVSNIVRTAETDELTEDDMKQLMDAIAHDGNDSLVPFFVRDNTSPITFLPPPLGGGKEFSTRRGQGRRRPIGRRNCL